MKHAMLTAAFVFAMGLSLAVPAGAADNSMGYDGRMDTTISASNLSTNDIIMVQQRLANDGYYQGSIDGVYGPRTASAVRSFQEANSLNASGRLTAATLDEMGLATRDKYTAVEPASGTTTYQESTVFGEMYTTRGVQGFSSEEFDAHHSTCTDCADGIYGHGGRPDAWDR